MTISDRPLPSFAATPLSFDELVSEIAACSDLDRKTIRAKLWQEAVGPGNVVLDAGRFDITPHVYDAAMEPSIGRVMVSSSKRSCTASAPSDDNGTPLRSCGSAGSHGERTWTRRHSGS